MSTFQYDFHVANNSLVPHVSIDLVRDDDDVTPVIHVPLCQGNLRAEEVEIKCETLAKELSYLDDEVERSLEFIKQHPYGLTATLVYSNCEIML